MEIALECWWLWSGYFKQYQITMWCVTCGVYRREVIVTLVWEVPDQKREWNGNWWLNQTEGINGWLYQATCEKIGWKLSICLPGTGSQQELFFDKKCWQWNTWLLILKKGQMWPLIRSHWYCPVRASSDVCEYFQQQKDPGWIMDTAVTTIREWFACGWVMMFWGWVDWFGCGDSWFVVTKVLTSILGCFDFLSFLRGYFLSFLDLVCLGDGELHTQYTHCIHRIQIHI